MPDIPLQRRAVLGAAAASALAIATGRRAAAATGADETYSFEVTRTEADWRAMLSREEYNVLRKGSTELPETSALWNNTAEGAYACRGCALPVYDSVWKVEVPMGWAFFSQSRENAVLMGIDGAPPGVYPPDARYEPLIEAHCRRCGSHLGHILTVHGKTLHCINGTSLHFEAASA